MTVPPTVADLLTHGLSLPPRDMPLVALPPNTVDATFGHPITHGIAIGIRLAIRHHS